MEIKNKVLVMGSSSFGGASFVNFILISYRLLIEKVTFLQELVPELWMFAALFIVIYIPLATIIGYWHRRTQLRVETTLVNQQNPILARMMRTLLDVQTGKASQEEIDEFRKMYSRISVISNPFPRNFSRITSLIVFG